MPLVERERKPPALILRLNRPDKRNALSRDLIAALHEAFSEARADASRVVILTANGPAFCAGMDLAELAACLDLADAEAAIARDAQRLSDLYELVYTLPKPTIAVVQGPAVAGGAGLVSVCDLAVASQEARFGYPEVRRGLVAAIVMPHLLRHVGERAARDLLLRGELVDAWTAWRIGLINEVADDPSALAYEWARQLAQAAPQALASTKALLQRLAARVPREETVWGSAAARLTIECREGLRAFLDKRPPPWATSS
ncbi:MAG: enoyl-CoA hydratase [Gemmataceae bacterium]